MTALNERQQLGRAKNAVGEYLTHKLLVPKIYLDADWDGNHLDVLAIDRAGVGDAHAVLLVFRSSVPDGWFSDAASVLSISEANEKVEELKLKTPCQCRYVGIVNVTEQPVTMGPSQRFKVGTFAEDGIGRIGLLEIDLLGDMPRVEEVIRAERFRSTKHILELTDKFVVSHTADAEYRDPVYDLEVSA